MTSTTDNIHHGHGQSESIMDGKARPASHSSRSTTVAVQWHRRCHVDDEIEAD